MRRVLLVAAIATAMMTTSRPSRAAFLQYAANLSGPNESPSNASPGVGTATVGYDTVAHTISVQASFSGLIGNTTASHIHAATALPGVGTAGVATQVPTFLNLPLGVSAGTFSQLLDLTLATSYNPAYVTANGGTTAAAEAALTGSFAAGTSYLNIHTTSFPGGEIRGFLTPVPEPSALALLGIGTAALIAMSRRRPSGL